MSRIAQCMAALLLSASPASIAAASDPVRPAPPPPAAVIDAFAIPDGTTGVLVDGHLNDEIWALATPIEDFVQREPDEGAPSTHRTEVRVVYDRTALFIAIRAFDPDPDEIVGHLTRRDADSPSDWVRILIDSFQDNRTAYEFAINVAGVKQDRYWFNDTNNDPGWDAVWEAAARPDADGWHAELRIPFSQLRFNPGATDGFGFAVVRNIQHANETATWPLLARSASGYVSSFGELRGLDVTPVQKRLEVAPYVVAQMATSPMAAESFVESSPDGNVSAGVDLKYKLAPGLTLTGTINPDFGQVEADPAVVNLGAFETFFAERRPFFVEGSGNFAFDVDCNDGQCTGLFYSRRIGRAPQRTASAPEGGHITQPLNTTILGAAKLTGRVGAFSIGALTAVTGNEDARFATSAAVAPSRTPVEPASSYSVMRVSREFADSSRVSMMLTNTSRRLSDELRFLPESAVSGGIDFDWRLGSRYSLTGFAAGSRVAGSAAAIDRLQRSTVHSFQRPDAGHLTYDPFRTSLAGQAGQLSFGKISGQRTRMQSVVSYKTPGFEINDLGFQARADEINQSNWFQIRDETPGRLVRTANINFNQWAGWNFDGDLRYAGGNVNSHWTLLSNWAFGGGVGFNARGFADRLTRGGPGGYTSPNLHGWLYMNTDNRRLMSANLSYNWFVDQDRSRNWSLSPGITVRPSSALSTQVNVNFSRNLRDAQWLENLTAADGSRHYVFGRLDQTTVGISTRVNYTLSPTLTLQVYAQPFVSTGGFDQFKELVDGRADGYDDRYAPFAYARNPDFNLLSFRTTNVLRWEYRPGSALFVVWQQGREDLTGHGDFQFGRDFSDAFGAPATNTFLVKFSRWLNF